MWNPVQTLLWWHWVDYAECWCLKMRRGVLMGCFCALRWDTLPTRLLAAPWWHNQRWERSVPAKCSTGCEDALSSWNSALFFIFIYNQKIWLLCLCSRWTCANLLHFQIHAFKHFVQPLLLFWMHASHLFFEVFVNVWIPASTDVINQQSPHRESRFVLDQ